MFDPPKVVTYCAPSLKARYFGKEENRKRYGYASVATTVNDALEVLGVLMWMLVSLEGLCRARAARLLLARAIVLNQ